MTFNSVKLEEFIKDEPLKFDPSKQMLCWDNECDSPVYDTVIAYIPFVREDRVKTTVFYPVRGQTEPWRHCVEIPENWTTPSVIHGEQQTIFSVQNIKFYIFP